LDEGCFGIDVSHYQGQIQWPALEYIKDSIPVSFVIMRASMGKDGYDAQFNRNWKNSKKRGVMRGAYHYYRPNENSKLQADLFIDRVTLQPDDIPPILDIEALPSVDIQSLGDLRRGLKNWLAIVEKHYGVRPIIYTGDHFYRDNLSGHGFDEYPVWIANYNAVLQPNKSSWALWQFSDSGVLPGIDGKVDLNVFNGNCSELLNELTS